MASQPMQPLIAMYRSNVEICRRWADLMLDNAEKFEGIGLRYARGAIAKGFTAAETAATTHPTSAARGLQPDPKALEDLVGIQREIATSMAEATQQMSRLMSEYTGNMARSMGSGMPSMPGMPGMSGTQGADALVSFWSQASKQMTDMMQTWSQTAPQMMRAASGTQGKSGEG